MYIWRFPNMGGYPKITGFNAKMVKFGMIWGTSILGNHFFGHQ